jgi:hypothetical protein
MRSKGDFNITIVQIYNLAIGGSLEKLDNLTSRRLGKILKKLGYVRRKFRVDDKNTDYGWSKA